MPCGERSARPDTELIRTEFLEEWTSVVESLRISLSDVQVKVNDAMSESLEIKHD